MSLANEDRVVNLLGRISTTQDEHGRTLEKLDHTINGNGSPGLKTIVDRHEQTLKVYRRVAWAIVAPAVAALGVGLISLARNSGVSHEANVPPHPSADTQPARVVGSDARLLSGRTGQFPVVPSSQ